MKKIGIALLLSFVIAACNSAKNDTNKENKIAIINKILLCNHTGNIVCTRQIYNNAFVHATLILTLFIAS